MADQPAGKDRDTGREKGRAKCPICGRPGEERYTPFCSRRCADVDLARWLRGAYVIPDREKGSDPARRTPEGTKDSDPTGEE